jgi:hypothetical protein
MTSIEDPDVLIPRPFHLSLASRSYRLLSFGTEVEL